MQVVGAVYKDWPQLLFVYKVVWSAVCQFVPLLILIVCNVCLIRALRQSRELRQLCRASYRPTTSSCRTAVRTEAESSSENQRITPTLIALIIVYVICVSPSALLFVFNVVGDGGQMSWSRDTYFVYQTATVVANCLFLVNFAANFVLYCVVNVRFRRMAREVLCGACSSSGQRTDRRATATAADTELMDYHTSRRTLRRNDE